MVRKFRCWDNKTETMFDVTGVNYNLKVVYGLNTEGIAYNQKVLSFKDHEVLQSTGMFDTNGKEIFEGDIIKLTVPNTLKCGVYQVRQANSGEWRIDNRLQGMDLYFYKDDVEVIGHKYMAEFKGVYE